MFSFNLYSQKNGIFLGPSIGIYPEQSIRLQVDQQWRYVRQEYAIQFNIEGELNIQAKMGFGLNTRRLDIFAYLPYLNFNTKVKNYNTPFSVEFFFKKRRSREWYDRDWFPNISACFDVYKDRMIPILRFKYQIVR